MNKFKSFIFLKELEKFCEEHLVDLIDNDYKINITEIVHYGKSANDLSLDVYKVVISNFINPLNWESINQPLNSFLEIITDEYVIKPIEVETKNVFKDIAINGKGLDIDEILNKPILVKRKIENMTVNDSIKSIWFHIENKYTEKLKVGPNQFKPSTYLPKDYKI